MEPTRESTCFAPACECQPCTATATDVDGSDNGAYLSGQAEYTTTPNDNGEREGQATDVIIELEPTAPDTGD